MDVAATAVTEVIAVFGTGKAEAGNEAVLHVSTGALAFATLSDAWGFFSFAFFSSSNVLMPGKRPVTVPLIVPGPLGASAEVTSWPFSSSVARAQRRVRRRDADRHGVAARHENRIGCI